MCNGVLLASRAGSGTRSTKSNAASRINKEALKRVPYPLEEGVEQMCWEPSAYEGGAGASLLMFLKCSGD